jgi:predicted nucleic acid-binding protein
LLVSAEARDIRRRTLAVECANVLWKKVRGAELPPPEAQITACLLQGRDLELMPMRALLATCLAFALGHSAYDCAYLALAAIDLS